MGLAGKKVAYATAGGSRVNFVYRTSSYGGWQCEGCHDSDIGSKETAATHARSCMAIRR